MMTRTTIRISSSLLHELKQRALEHNRSLASEIDAVIRLGLNAYDSPTSTVKIPIFERGRGTVPLVDLTKTSDLLAMDEEDAAD
jgi:hypothetical protein